MTVTSKMTPHLHESLATAPVVGEVFANYELTAEETAVELLGARQDALISLAVSLVIPCERLAKMHLTAARDAGVTKRELAETAYSAAALRLGGALGYGRLSLKYVSLGDPRADDPASCDLHSRLDPLRMADLRRGGPAPFESFMEMRRSLHEDLALSPLDYELIATAGAITTQCAYCIDLHARSAVDAGASKEQLSAVIHRVASIRAAATLQLAAQLLQ